MKVVKDMSYCAQNTHCTSFTSKIEEHFEIVCYTLEVNISAKP